MVSLCKSVYVSVHISSPVLPPCFGLILYILFDVLELWYFGFTLITVFYQILICSASIYDIVSSPHVKFLYHLQCYYIVNICP